MCRFKWCLIGVLITLPMVSWAGASKYAWDIDSGIKWSLYSGFSFGVPVRAFSADTNNELIAINTLPSELETESAVKVYDWDSQFRVWGEPVKLRRDAHAGGEEFGLSISVDGSRIAVGAPDWGNGTGSVYVFTRNPADGRWVRTARIQESSTGFGRVVLKGDLMVVGSLELRNQPVYVYRLSNGDWIKEAELHGDSTYQGFGRSLDIDGNRVAVGAHHENDSNGSVYIYQYQNGSWTLEQKVTSPSARYFGTSLDLEGGRLVVGAPGGANSVTWDSLGTVHVFQFGASGWNEVAELTPQANNQMSDLFGFSVQISEEGFVAVGAPGVKDDAHDVDGAVYLFGNAGGSAWKQVVHVASSSTGDYVLLRGGLVYTSGDTGMSIYSFETKQPRPEDQNSGSSGASGSGSGGGGGAVNLLLLFGALFAVFRAFIFQSR